MIRATALLTMLLAATTASAQESSCVVDYETMQVRPLSMSDPVTMLPEQTLGNYDWALDSVVRVAGQDYGSTASRASSGGSYSTSSASRIRSPSCVRSARVPTPK